MYRKVLHLQLSRLIETTRAFFIFFFFLKLNIDLLSRGTLRKRNNLPDKVWLLSKSYFLSGLKEIIWVNQSFQFYHSRYLRRFLFKTLKKKEGKKGKIFRKLFFFRDEIYAEMFACPRSLVFQLSLSWTLKFLVR